MNIFPAKIVRFVDRYVARIHEDGVIVTCGDSSNTVSFHGSDQSLEVSLSYPVTALYFSRRRMRGGYMLRVAVELECLEAVLADIESQQFWNKNEA